MHNFQSECMYSLNNLTHKNPTHPVAHVSKAQIKMVRSLQQKKFRDQLGLFVAEGHKCIEELQKRFRLEYLFSEYNATETEIAQMSSLRTPQGLIGVFTMPENTDNQIDTHSLSLALDSIQDPGNLGTIIRTCDWFGVRDIYCSRDTADCFNAKVVQATMGALARVQVHYVDLVPLLTRAREVMPVYGTLLNGRNMYEQGAIADKSRGVIVMGNEGNGISEAVRPLITHPLFIPSFPTGVATSESLNVSIATAITLAEFRRL